MARTKEFDPDDVLRRAMDLFWERGWDNTSMADLVDHLGIGRASLYSTFGSKRDLYFQALNRYLEMTGPHIIRPLSEPGPVLPAIEALIDRFAEESSESNLGCMVANTAVELAARDSEAARVVDESWTHLEVSLTAALTRAQAQDELARDKDPRAIARLLLVLFQGMRVLGRTNTPPARLRDAASQAKTLLTPERN
jgi:TetR/AcrR family transcriptional repressor of nem operon